MLERFNTEYWRYSTTLDDPRIEKFIYAMQNRTPISFKDGIFIIQHIHLTPKSAIVVLKEVI